MTCWQHSTGGIAFVQGQHQPGSRCSTRININRIHALQHHRCRHSLDHARLELMMPPHPALGWGKPCRKRSTCRVSWQSSTFRRFRSYPPCRFFRQWVSLNTTLWLSRTCKIFSLSASRSLALSFSNCLFFSISSQCFDWGENEQNNPFILQKSATISPSFPLSCSIRRSTSLVFSFLRSVPWCSLQVKRQTWIRHASFPWPQEWTKAGF